MISMDKQYRTRDGREVRIYAVDGNESGLVHGAIKRHSDGRWVIYQWQADGSGTLSTACDLIEVKPTITRTYWLVHFKKDAVDSFTAEHRALSHAESCAGNVIAITGPHSVTFEEGQGL